MSLFTAKCSRCSGHISNGSIAQDLCDSCRKMSESAAQAGRKLGEAMISPFTEKIKKLEAELSSARATIAALEASRAALYEKLEAEKEDCYRTEIMYGKLKASLPAAPSGEPVYRVVIGREKLQAGDEIIISSNTGDRPFKWVECSANDVGDAAEDYIAVRRRMDGK